MYVSWNAMFVSAYLEAEKVLEGALAESSRAFALKTMDRMLRETWGEEQGFAHRIGGGAALRGHWMIRCWRGWRCWMLTKRLDEVFSGGAADDGYCD